MLVTVNGVGLIDKDIDHPEEVKSLVEHYAKVDKLSVMAKRSGAFQDLRQSYAAPKGFQVLVNAPISPAFLSEKRANYRVDMAISSQKNGTSIPVEIAFNNRESIGTNLLKLEAYRGAVDGSTSTPFGVIIVPTSSLLEFGGWDSSYGDNLEYEDLRLRIYGSALSLPIYLIELHGLF